MEWAARHVADPEATIAAMAAIAAMQPYSCVAVQSCSHAAMQPCSHAAVQPCSFPLPIFSTQVEPPPQSDYGTELADSGATSLEALTLFTTYYWLLAAC